MTEPIYKLVSSLNNPVNGTYYLIKPSHLYVGFCGYLWQVIRGIYKYPDSKYHILIGRESSNNVWDFYFEQPYILRESDKIISEVGLLFDEESEFVDLYPCMKKLTPEQKEYRWKTFNSITKKYFKLGPAVKEKVEKFKNEHFDGKKVFAFHCRGTDHPDRRDISYSFSEIDEALESHDLMFASSDEKDIMTALNSRYGNKLISYHSSTRSEHCDFQMARGERTETTHAFRYNAIINWSKSNEGYQIGEDIMVETHLMASAQSLLCACNSNVNYFVRALNNLPTKVIYTPTL